jgi:short-subunit dehydrogenase
MRRTILITGASSGLGAEMARQFVAAGHDLVLTARREDRLAALRDELLARLPDRTVLVKSLDVTDHDQVFKMFAEADEEIGGLDRVIVNAGIGNGAPIGTGRFDANRGTAMTNFVAALAQCEAAMEIFRARNAGHLVVISSVSALRGMPRTMTVYGATKAAVASMAEGIRMEMLGKPIKVSTIYAGYIRSEMNERLARPPAFMVGTETGVRAIVAAIEAEKPKALVPAWPWRLVGPAIRVLPLPVVKRMI